MLEEEKLNEDQIRTLKSLPSLEAIVKELDEVKKAVEVRRSRIFMFPSDSSVFRASRQTELLQRLEIWLSVVD